jgi:hypothetical protein
MRQSQAEIKAIEAELRSIRADSKVTLLDPSQWVKQQADLPIAPTIDRQALMASGQERASTQSKSSRPVAVSAQQRSVECFPLATHYANDYDNSSSFGASRRAEPRQPRSRRHSERQLAAPAEPFNGSQSQHRARLLLAEKANQINALSNQQEAIILELMSLSETLSERLDPEIQPICEYRTAEVPYVETAKTGTLRLKSRAVDLSYLDSEDGYRLNQFRRPGGFAGLLSAAALLVWQTTWGLVKTIGTVARLATAPITGLAKLLLGWSAPTTAPTRRRPSRRAVETPFTLREAAVLVIGSALLRIGLDGLVVLYPVLWIPSILVMLTPAAIAVYRATLSPPTGFAWGYRLFSIMIGLLLGGRL